MTAYRLDLSGVADRIGATFASNRRAGEMNAWGNSYPAEELPFGTQLPIGSVRYELVPKSPVMPSQPDHVEMLGQLMAAGPPGQPARALAVLAAGEMGPQEMSVRVHLATGDVCVRSATIPGWMLRPQTPPSPDQFRCDHLHYPGGYRLSLLVPVLWSRVLPLPGAAVTAIELMPNPLIHVFAITLLDEAVT